MDEMPRAGAVNLIEAEKGRRTPPCAVGAVVALSATLAAAVGIAIGYMLFWNDSAQASMVELGFISPEMPALPSACDGWQGRCLVAANAAANVSLGPYWPASYCVPGAKFSCKSRLAAWQEDTMWLSPRSGPGSGRLVLFLPGTGGYPQEYRKLLSAAAIAGHHVIGLSYSSYPFSVGASNVWCTSGGGGGSATGDAGGCNVALHESVLFGNVSGAPSAIWPTPANESVSERLVRTVGRLRWDQFLYSDGTLAWPKLIVSGHSQGASHAAYLSLARPVAAAVLFSGPQECPRCTSAWPRAADPSTLRRGIYSRREACGDAPHDPSEYCASQFGGGVLRSQLQAMGLERGLLGANDSGYVVVDFPPLLETGRPYHCSVAMDAFAPPGIVPIFETLFASGVPRHTRVGPSLQVS
jgi:pimeloyl-ACP methyl ester carboxylesterase